jgi:hypothetical protein
MIGLSGPLAGSEVAFEATQQISITLMVTVAS